MTQLSSEVWAQLSKLPTEECDDLAELMLEEMAAEHQSQEFGAKPGEATSDPAVSEGLQRRAR